MQRLERYYYLTKIKEKFELDKVDNTSAVQTGTKTKSSDIEYGSAPAESKKKNFNSDSKLNTALISLQNLDQGCKVERQLQKKRLQMGKISDADLKQDETILLSCNQIHEEVQNIHLDMLRQFQIQKVIIN